METAIAIIIASIIGAIAIPKPDVVVLHDQAPRTTEAPVTKATPAQRVPRSRVTESVERDLQLEDILFGKPDNKEN